MFEKRCVALSLVVFGLLAAFGAHAEVIDIDSAGLERLMKSGVPVIDIRTAPEWKETGIVPGSHLLTFFDEKGNAEPGGWLGRASAVAKREAPVVLICRSGNRTAAVAQFLSQKAGYTRVYNVKDGIRAWIKEGRPVVAATSSTAR